MGQGTDLWLHNRVKTLEAAPTSSDNPGQFDSYWATIARYDQNSSFSHTSSSIYAHQATGLEYFGFAAANLARTTNADHQQFHRFRRPPIIHSCNVITTGSDDFIHDETENTGYSSSNTYNYPHLGVRLFAIENTSASNVTGVFNILWSGYSTYSGYSLWAVTPSGALTNGKYTASVDSLLYGGTSNSSSYASQSYDFPANTVVLFVLITSARYLTSSSNGFIMHMQNGIYSLNTLFQNTALKPRNDFPQELIKGGLVDNDLSGTNVRDPANLWNKLVLKKSMVTPTGYAHLE
tara:strand:+ start:11920 stop:12798 length:879 start_codon:yes stop_codon:yes gene_type:complete